ncbi:uncharacterized protein LOC133287699 [Gastrolobium bilobum]|uniref:uncharacterized protein LOC133287699 n=1 Tax=Gastrolobium bilobum TaxID=150636 RepID=UPI002AB27FDC|nr:uncharacterized protein LOC133287699 [Gastrolobium bilobum]
MGNRSSSNSKVRGYGIKGASFRGEEFMGKPKAETPSILRGQHVHGVYSEQQYETPLDDDDTFTDYIRSAKSKIRTVSNINRKQSNSVRAPAPVLDGANGTKNKANQRDQFSDFIQLAKKKLRTTSRIGKNSSFNRG